MLVKENVLIFAPSLWSNHTPHKPKSELCKKLKKDFFCNEFSKFELVDIDEVVSLGEKEEDVYDMEVEGTHCFFANNVLSITLPSTLLAS